MKHIPNIRARSIVNSFRLLTIILIVAFSTLGYASDSAPDAERMGDDASNNSNLNKQCISVKDAQPPKSDLPSVQTSSALNGCIPTDLYYEAKGKMATNNADWQKVKDCAFTENNGDEVWKSLVLQQTKG